MTIERVCQWRRSLVGTIQRRKDKEMVVRCENVVEPWKGLVVGEKYELQETKNEIIVTQGKYSRWVQRKDRDLQDDVDAFRKMFVRILDVFSIEQKTGERKLYTTFVNKDTPLNNMTILLMQLHHISAWWDDRLRGKYAREVKLSPSLRHYMFEYNGKDYICEA